MVIWKLLKDYTFAGTGSIAGSTGLTKSGAAKLTLGTTYSFTGPVVINAGTVSVATLANTGLDSGLGGGTTITLGDGSNLATLEYTGVSTTTNRPIAVGFGGAKISVTNPGAILTTTGGMVLDGPLTKQGTGALTVSSVISGFGGLTVDAGTVTFTAANSFSGGLTVNSGGTVQTNTGGGATGLGIADVTVNAGGTLIGGAEDSFGYTAGVSPNLININGGTVTDRGTGNYRVTLPNLSFTGGTMTSAVGNVGDANGNYSFFGKGNGGLLVVNADATSSTVNVNGTNTTYFTASQTLAALNIGDGGTVILTSTAPAPLALGGGAFADPGEAFGDAGPGVAVAAVPEPGAIALLLLGTAGMLGRRRRSR